MKLAFILSLPRSGSTVLSAQLDRIKGILSPPESSFPQVLSVVSPKERSDKKWLAALYIGSTFVPTPLSLQDAEACMNGTDEEILISLGLALAPKLNRNPEDIKVIVWKTPRTIGFHKCPLATNGKFIIIRRNPHNVFESQFRVDFGRNNRNPMRFAIFLESYEHAFARLPRPRVFEMSYDSLIDQLPDLTSFLGLQSQELWPDYSASLELAAKHCGHMTTVTQDFQNFDPIKRKALTFEQIKSLKSSLKIARYLRPFLGPVRAHFDHSSMNTIRGHARRVLAEVNTSA